MMFHTKAPLFLKKNLNVIRTWEWHHTFVLLLLTVILGGDSQIASASKPIVAMVGSDMILPCHIEPALEAKTLTLEWSRSDLNPRFVLLRRDGSELLREKNPMYNQRTSVALDKLKRGDVSLIISKVKLSDAGTYRCLVPSTGTNYDIKLIVGSVSTQDVGVSKFSGGVSLDCKSKGWYPEPEVSWLDSKGKNLSAVRTEKLKGPDGLYAVSSRLTVEERHSESFTCRVQQKKIDQTRETHVQLGVELFMVESSSAVRISICIAVCLMAIVGVALLLWKYGPNKETQKHQEAETKMRGRSSVNGRELLLLMENEGDGEKPTTVSEKIRLLDKTKVKLDEQLEKNEGDMEHVAGMITKLTGQKEALKKQRQKINSLLQDDKVQMEKNKKQRTTTPKTSKNNKKQKRKNDDLEKRKKEHDDLLENTEKLLETTDAMINTMTERRGRLENEKEKIQKQLKDVERRREETLRENETQPGRNEGLMKLHPELPDKEKP